VIKARASQLKGEARNQWGQLTDDDWERSRTERDVLVSVSLDDRGASATGAGATTTGTGI
jgi:hypothetical protein